MRNEFSLGSVWRVKGTADEVAAILTDAPHFPSWWAEVYLGAKIISPGDDDGIGRQVAVHSKGRLPYDLHWIATLVESDMPHRWRITASGDLTGWGEWRITENGPMVEARYDWHVTADKPILRLLSPLLAPVFAWNHRWAMAKGEAGLRRELVRRRAVAQQEMALHEMAQ
jgi:Polyketide cyclase / dehydrase and lipid transport